MVTTFLALISIKSASFFPMEVGAKYVYEETSNGKARSEDVVKPEIIVKGLPCFPVETRGQGAPVQINIYREEDGVLFLIGTDPKSPLPEPFPVAKIPTGPGSIRWDFKGKVSAAKGAETIEMIGEARLAGSRKVFGKNADLLEVKVRSALGDVVPLLTEQTSIYARGIGLIESSSVTRINKREVKSKLVLKEYIPASEAPTQ
ncbi:MAG: hypothetical protein ACOYON_12165 [Fimbriimonas sp.]